MTQRAVITGASGLLGRQLVRAFELAGWETTGTGFTRASPPKIRKVDIRNEHEVTQLLDETKPDVIVHCAADRRPESCTGNPEAAKMLNVMATKHLASAAESKKIFLIYISTDYVFPGKPGQAPYKPSDEPQPTNMYGETKLDGERVLQKFCPSGVILRVPVLYGPTEPHDNHQESAVNILMDSLVRSQKEKVKMDDWALRYPTNTQDVARVCVDISKLYLSNRTAKPQKDLPQILQFSSEDKMTKYEIVQKLAEIMRYPMDNVVPDKDGGKPSPDGTVRPYDCHLSSDVLKDIGIDVGTMSFVDWWKRYVGAFRH